MYNNTVMNDTITYLDSKIKLETVYKVEYIDNKKDFEILEADKHPAPWELYKVKKYDSLHDAISFFMFKLADQRIYDVRFFEEILIDSEIVRERCIDDIFNFSGIVDSETQRIKRAIDDKKYIYNDMEEELKIYREFIKKYNAEKILEEYKKDIATC